MTRFNSSANETAASQARLCMAIAVDLDFPSGHLRLHDGPGPLTIGGNTFEGTGKVQLLDKIEESIEVIAKPVKMVLSGVDASIIATARAGGYQGRQVIIYLALFDNDTGNLVDTPEIAWEGRMDTISIRLGRDEASLTLNCEHRLRREPLIARNTDADQQLAYPGDRFFDLVGKIPGFRGTWGVKGVANDGNAPTNPRDVVDSVLRRLR